MCRLRHLSLANSLEQIEVTKAAADIDAQRAYTLAQSTAAQNLAVSKTDLDSDKSKNDYVTSAIKDRQTMTARQNYELALYQSDLTKKQTANTQNSTPLTTFLVAEAQARVAQAQSKNAANVTASIAAQSDEVNRFNTEKTKRADDATRIKNAETQYVTDSSPIQRTYDVAVATAEIHYAYASAKADTHYTLTVDKTESASRLRVDQSLTDFMAAHKLLAQTKTNDYSDAARGAELRHSLSNGTYANYSGYGPPPVDTQFNTERNTIRATYQSALTTQRNVFAGAMEADYVQRVNELAAAGTAMASERNTAVVAYFDAVQQAYNTATTGLTSVDHTLQVTLAGSAKTLEYNLADLEVSSLPAEQATEVTKLTAILAADVVYATAKANKEMQFAQTMASKELVLAQSWNDSSAQGLYQVAYATAKLSFTTQLATPYATQQTAHASELKTYELSRLAAQNVADSARATSEATRRKAVADAQKTVDIAQFDSDQIVSNALAQLDFTRQGGKQAHTLVYDQDVVAAYKTYALETVRLEAIYNNAIRAKVDYSYPLADYYYEGMLTTADHNALSSGRTAADTKLIDDLKAALSKWQKSENADRKKYETGDGAASTLVAWPAVTEAAALAGSTTAPSVPASPDNWLSGIEAWQKVKKADLDHTLQNAIAAAGRVRDGADIIAQTAYWTSEVGAKNAKRTSETASDIAFWQSRENVRYAAHSQIHASLGTSWSGYLKDAATASISALSSLVTSYDYRTTQRNGSEILFQSIINDAYETRETTLANLRRDDEVSKNQRDAKRAADVALSEQSFLKTIGLAAKTYADELADNASASNAAYKEAHAAAFKDFYKAEAQATRDSDLTRINREQKTRKDKSAAEEVFREIESGDYYGSVHRWTNNDQIFKVAKANAQAQAAQIQFGSGSSPWGTRDAQYLASQIAIVTDASIARRDADRDNAIAQYNSEISAALTEKTSEQSKATNSYDTALKDITASYRSSELYADQFVNNTDYHVKSPVLSQPPTLADDYFIEEVWLEKFYAFVAMPTEEAGMPESQWMFKDGRYMGINQPQWGMVRPTSFDAATGIGTNSGVFKADSSFDETNTYIWLHQQHNDSGLDVDLVSPSKLYERREFEGEFGRKILSQQSLFFAGHFAFFEADKLLLLDCDPTLPSRPKTPTNSQETVDGESVDPEILERITPLSSDNSLNGNSQNSSSANQPNSTPLTAVVDGSKSDPDAIRLLVHYVNSYVADLVDRNFYFDATRSVKQRPLLGETKIKYVSTGNSPTEKNEKESALAAQPEAQKQKVVSVNPNETDASAAAKAYEKMFPGMPLVTPMTQRDRADFDLSVLQLLDVLRDNLDSIASRRKPEADKNSSTSPKGTDEVGFTEMLSAIARSLGPTTTFAERDKAISDYIDREIADTAIHLIEIDQVKKQFIRELNMKFLGILPGDRVQLTDKTLDVLVTLKTAAIESAAERLRRRTSELVAKNRDIYGGPITVTRPNGETLTINPLDLDEPLKEAYTNDGSLIRNHETGAWGQKAWEPSRFDAQKLDAIAEQVRRGLRSQLEVIDEDYVKPAARIAFELTPVIGPASTLVDENATTTSKVIAGISLVLDILPILKPVRMAIAGGAGATRAGRLALDGAATEQAAKLLSPTRSVDNLTGKLGGEVLNKRQFQRLEQYLGSHGVDLKRGIKSSFEVFEGDKNPVLRLRRNATRYETLHELGHFLHYKQIGKAEYLGLARQVGANIPEKTVFELMAKPSRWNRLNQLEQNHSWNYMREYWGMDPTKSFFKWRQ